MNPSESIEPIANEATLFRVPKVKNPHISVVVPTMNEAKNLPYVASRMPDIVDEIVVVDGRSVDDTCSVARSLWPDAKILTQTRRGKGNALACGIATATGDIVVLLDADGSTDPAEIVEFVAALEAGADFAKGSRFVRGGGSSDITRIRAFGNKTLNTIVNLLFSTRYTDLCYGYNAFWSDVTPLLDLPPVEHLEAQWGDGFEVETLINVRVAAAGLTITEVASFEADRLHGVSNLHAVRDGLRVLRTIVDEKHRHSSATLRNTRSAQQLAVHLPSVHRARGSAHGETRSAVRNREASSQSSSVVTARNA